jgi:MarR family transcriptional regulator, lower aerobic nicotinate degradation pathway regulator
MTQNPYPNNLNIVDTLVQLSFAVQTVLLRIAAAHDLSLVQMRMFGILRDHRPEMLALARHMNLDKSSVSGLIDRAERRGLVQRIPSPEDGRVFRVSVTPLGRQITAEVASQVESEILELVAGLSDTDRNQLMNIVSLILKG